MRKLKIGIIGTGRFACRAHYPALAKIEKAEIVAICENAHLDRMDEMADKFHIPNKYTDYKKMLSKTEVDAVYALMRPTYGLTPIVCDILSAGKHLFIEKPPAISLADMKEMATAARESGCSTMVGFNRRFIPVLREAKRRVSERSISLIVGTFYKRELKNDWHPVSQLLSNGLHALDTIRWLADSEIKEIVAAKSKTFTDYDNSWQALIRFTNGIIGILSTSYSVGARFHTFEIHGRGISAFVDPDVSAVIYTDGNRKLPTVLDTREFAESEEFIEYYGIRAEDQHFVESVLNGENPSPDFEDALETMKLVEAIEKGTI